MISDELEQQEPVKLKGIWPKIKDIANSILPNHIALMIPISIRPVANWEMRNWSTGSVVWLPLPSGMRHGLPLGPRPMHARLHTVARRLRVLKNSLLPTLTFWSVQLTGQAPIIFPSAMWTPLRKTVQLFLELVLESFSAVVTNVPGPPSEIEFADTKVVSVNLWRVMFPNVCVGTMGCFPTTSWKRYPGYRYNILRRYYLHYYRCRPCHQCSFGRSCLLYTSDAADE